MVGLGEVHLARGADQPRILRVGMDDEPRVDRDAVAADAGADAAGWLDGFLFAQAGPIYAGTNEIQRNIIAERMLGLPKS